MIFRDNRYWFPVYDEGDSMTTAEAAAALNVSRRRVNELIKLGTLQAIKPGRDWEIEPASVEAYRDSPRKAGPKRKHPAADPHR